MTTLNLTHHCWVNAFGGSIVHSLWIDEGARSPPCLLPYGQQAHSAAHHLHVPGSHPAPSQVVGASLWELLSPHARCLGSTSSRSQGFTGGFKSPCLRPDSLAMLGYFLRRQQAHFDLP